MAMGFLILVSVRDSPEAIGFPPVEEMSQAPAAKPAAEAAVKPAATEPAEPKESLVDLLVNDVLK